MCWTGGSVWPARAIPALALVGGIGRSTPRCPIRLVAMRFQRSGWG